MSNKMARPILREHKFSNHRLIFIDLLEKRLGIVRAVVFDHLWRVAIVNLYNEFSELSSNSFVKLLQELESTALWMTAARERN